MPVRGIQHVGGRGAYRRSVDIGARIHFRPEEDRDLPGYYELFVFDPDGIRVEVACAPPGKTA